MIYVNQNTENPSVCRKERILYMNRKLQKIIAVLCAGALCVSLLAGCSLWGENSSSSSPDSSSASSQNSTENSTESSATPDSSAGEEESSSQSSEESSGNSMEDTSSEHSDILPDISADDPDFAVLFSANPLDAAYTAELEDATSTGKMIGIINKYLELWKVEVDAAYRTLMEKTTGDAKEDIRSQQETWINETDANIQAIQDGVEGDGSARQLEIASQIMAYYRARAATLYSQLFQIDPDFSFVYQPEEETSSES